MKKALVAAGGISQAALIKELKKRDIFVLVADRNPNAYAVQYADKFLQVSALDVEGLKKAAVEEKVDYVLTACADQVLEAVAKVSEELNLPCYIDYKTSMLVSDKQYMKEIFERNGIPTAKHVVLAKMDEQAVSKFEYPLIVKPVDCYSSRGVRKCENLDELKAAFQDAITLSRTKTAIIEEFCDGIELTVDAYVEEGKAHILTTSISDKIKDKDRFVIYRTKNPALISSEIETLIQSACQKIADAFHLINSPMLVQLISNGKRIDILEFCARTGGCIKYRLIEKASGFDVIKAVVDLTLGDKPHVGKLKSQSKYITNTFLYCRPGTFDHLEGFEELKKEGIISEYFQFASKGSIYEKITCSGDRIAAFTIQDEDLKKMNCKSQLAMERVKAIDIEGNDMIRHDLVEDLIY